MYGIGFEKTSSGSSRQKSMEKIKITGRDVKQKIQQELLQKNTQKRKNSISKKVFICHKLI